MFVDAVTDPIAAYRSDRTNTACARRRPFILGSALAFGLSLILLFNPPAGMADVFHVGWRVVPAVLVQLILTVFHVPHLALRAEMAQEYTDRT